MSQPTKAPAHYEALRGYLRQKVFMSSADLMYAGNSNEGSTLENPLDDMMDGLENLTGFPLEGEEREDVFQESHIGHALVGAGALTRSEAKAENTDVYRLQHDHYEVFAVYIPRSGRPSERIPARLIVRIQPKTNVAAFQTFVSTI